MAEAETTMADHEAMRLLVMADSGSLVGLVSRGDLRKARAEAGPSNTLTMADIMTPGPVVISEEATIGEAARVMLENNVSGLPVVDARGNVSGVITFTWGKAVNLARGQGSGGTG